MDHPIVRAPSIERRLRAVANGDLAAHHLRFFRTAPGEYGAGDRFLGISVPVIRALSREFKDLAIERLADALQSAWHEVRLLALVVLVRRYERGDEATREAIFNLYLSNTDRINNWDLVDVSAPNIVGAHLENRDRAVLLRLARSASLWERRIAIVSTAHFIRRNDFGDTLRIAEILLDDRQDLIHKAAGWMLREVGKRDRPAEERFLRKYARRMPRTMLRYAIERFPQPLRRRYMARD